VLASSFQPLRLTLSSVQEVTHFQSRTTIHTLSFYPILVPKLLLVLVYLPQPQLSMDPPTIDFVGESADKIKNKRVRAKSQKSSLPDSAKPPRKKRKTKPKLSTNVPSSANMDKSSQMPSTPTPTPPMFPPHGIHGHGHVQFTPPSMMIPGIASGPVQSGASPSSRQVMDMSPIHILIHTTKYPNLTLSICRVVTIHTKA
jgi:hypothetical protein